MSSIEVSCPETRRINNRRTRLKKKWTGKAWKERREGFIKSHGGKCEWCGRDKRLQVHHPFRNVYGSTVYDDFELSQCILLCQSCHAATEHNKELCTYENPKGLHSDGEYHYRYHDAPMCSFCYIKENPEVKQKAEQAKVEKKKKQKEARKAAYQKAKAAKAKATKLKNGGAK